MSRNSRKNLPGLFHHIMSQGINQEYIFDDDNLKEKYINIIKDKREKNNVNILAYCIMDNHVHLLLNAQNIDDISKFMHQVNTTYAKYYNKFNNRVGYVFRNRYLAKPILDENQLKRCVVYIHRNPVVAKIVKKENEYKFSSYKEYLTIIDKKNLINLSARKILFGKSTIKEVEEVYKSIHEYDDRELREFDDFEQKTKINLKELLNKYCNLVVNEKIFKLNLEEKISERKLAVIFEKTRYEIRKILKQESQKVNRDNQKKNVPIG